MASTSDLITDVRNSARPNSARASSGRIAGATTLSCDSLAGWPTASKVHGVTYQIDSLSNPVAGTQLDFYAIRSGNDLTSFTVVDPAVDIGNSINDVVEMLPTAAWGQDLADALTSTHNRSGGLKSSLTITNPTITTPTIASFANAAHTHADAAGGGQVPTAGIATDAVTTAKLQDGLIRARQGGASGDATWSSPGTTTVDTSAKRTITQCGALVAGAGTFSVVFPVAFAYTPIVVLTPRGSGGLYSSGNWYLVTESATGFDFQSGSANATSFTWIAIGQI